MLTIEVEREDDGRWIADLIEDGEPVPNEPSALFAPA
jgi:hypothetical protein